MTKLPSSYDHLASGTDSTEKERISRLIALVSHELKNPLSAIQLTAEMLSMYREHFSVEDQEKHLRSLLSNTQLLKELIDHSITYARLHYEVVAPVVQLVGLNEFLRNIQIEASEWVDCRHSIVFTPNSVDANVRLDVFQVKLVLEQLLKNAMHFSEPGQPILLEWSLSDGKIAISVTDEGVGIPEAQQHLVFDLFYRTKDLRGQTGTGLGLSIAKEIMDKNRGTLHILPHKPQGTIAKITFDS